MSEPKQNMLFHLPHEHATQEWARCLAAHLVAPLLITLSGDIGAGKTSMVRAMLRALGINTPIKSPTYSLVESYSCSDFVAHHFDLYRIHQEEELEYIGFREFFSDHSICCIEWPEHAGHLLPPVDLQCQLRVNGMGRDLVVDAASSTGQRILTAVIQEYALKGTS